MVINLIDCVAYHLGYTDMDQFDADVESGKIDLEAEMKRIWPN